jgi:hypothetical protein
VCIAKLHDQLGPCMDAELPTNAFQVRPNGTGSQPQKASGPPLAVAQHKALKDFDLAIREPERSGDALPGRFTKEARIAGGSMGIAHRGPFRVPGHSRDRPRQRSDPCGDMSHPPISELRIGEKNGRGFWEEFFTLFQARPCTDCCVVWRGNWGCLG